MATSLAAKHAKGKKLKDVIFVTSGQAQADAKAIGKENVLNGTVGSILNEDGNLVFLKTVKEAYLNLPDADYVGYAPIEGIPEFLEAVQNLCFGNYKPEGYIRDIATAGGTGGVHHLIYNYTDIGDEVLTADWYWGSYKVMCNDCGRTLVTYSLFDDENKFNHVDFQAKVNTLCEKQDNIVVIFNTPGNNPTGYSIPEADWDQILDFLKTKASSGKNIIIGVDVAYIDYSGDKEAVRKFFKKFGNLPKEMLTVVCYSISKGFTMYGQRVGAMIGVSADKDVADEFYEINKMTSRATWSNICRPAMKTVVNLVAYEEKYKAYEAERDQYDVLIHERANIFKEEAEECGLPMLPYHGGFFITIPTDSATEICEELKKDHIYVIALANGIRVAACGIPKRQMKGLAGKMFEVMKRLGKL